LQAMIISISLSPLKAEGTTVPQIWATDKNR